MILPTLCYCCPTCQASVILPTLTMLCIVSCPVHTSSTCTFNALYCLTVHLYYHVLTIYVLYYGTVMYCAHLHCHVLQLPIPVLPPYVLPN